MYITTISNHLEILMKTNTSRALAVTGAVALLVTLGGVGGAVAAHQITSGEIKNGTIRQYDLNPNAVKAFTAPGPKGATGAKGAAGDSYLKNAYYAVAYYDAGDTNSGAIATVACNNTTDTAISGGVQVLGLDADANSRNTPVSSSFPGRMDWSANAPYANRLDGWIVQFGGGSVAPEKAKVWALCAPGLSISVDQNYTESD